MTKRLIHCAILLTIALCLSESIAQAQKLSSKNPESNRTERIAGSLQQLKQQRIKGKQKLIDQ